MWGDQKRDVLFGSFGDDHIGVRGGNDVLYGSLGNDALDGGTGLDTAMFSAARTSYSASRGASTYSVTGVDGTDTLNGIERLQFSDRKIALDLGQGEAAGNTVRLIGAAFDTNFITPEFVGIGIDLFDSGASLAQVAELALGTSVYQSIAGSRSNVDFVNTIYRNVVGTLPSESARDFFVSLLQGSGGTMSQAELLAIAANDGLNAANINLVGLQQSGIEFV